MRRETCVGTTGSSQPFAYREHLPRNWRVSLVPGLLIRVCGRACTEEFLLAFIRPVHVHLLSDSLAPGLQVLGGSIWCWLGPGSSRVDSHIFLSALRGGPPCLSLLVTALLLTESMHKEAKVVALVSSPQNVGIKAFISPRR